MVYQSDHCYSPEFAKCSVFLAWAARNAAEPAFVTEAAQKAWGSGIAAPEGSGPPAEQAPVDPDEAGADEGEALAPPSPEGGLFGMAEPSEPKEVRTTEQLDWVSASAWTEAPWDERAENEADELEELEEEEPDEEEEEPEQDEGEEATELPKVPAALPMRRRKPPQEPIRSRGSGEWFYADAPGRDPLVSRRYGVTPPILLAVLGILLVSIVVFLLATQIGGDESSPAAAASPSVDPSFVAAATRAPLLTAEPSLEPSPTPVPKPKFYKVKAGDSLSGIAAKFDVKATHLQCLNGITNRNIIVLGARYQIPPEGFSCPAGWRKATPEP
jgi:LysM repeat protein